MKRKMDQYHQRKKSPKKENKRLIFITIYINIYKTNVFCENKAHILKVQLMSINIVEVYQQIVIKDLPSTQE